MKRYVAVLDTNILLRFLLADHPAQSPPAARLIENASVASLYLAAVIIAEIAWVLKWRYHTPRSGIRDALQRVMEAPSIHADSITRNAVRHYASTNLDIANCLLADRAEAGELPLPQTTYERGAA